MLARLKIFARLTALQVIMIALMAGVAGFGFSGLSDTRRNIENIYQNNLVTLQQVSTIIENYYRIRVRLLQAIASGDPVTAKKHVDEIPAYLAAIDENW